MGILNFIPGRPVMPSHIANVKYLWPTNEVIDTANIINGGSDANRSSLMVAYGSELGGGHGGSPSDHKVLPVPTSPPFRSPTVTVSAATWSAGASGTRANARHMETWTVLSPGVRFSYYAWTPLQINKAMNTIISWGKFLQILLLLFY